MTDLPAGRQVCYSKFTVAKAEFLQKKRREYEGNSLGELESRIGDRLARLMQEKLDADSSVYNDLMTLLALRLFRAERLFEAAEDVFERGSAEVLRERYAAIFRNPTAIDQWAYWYCTEQADYYVAREDPERVERWRGVGRAMERVIRVKVYWRGGI